MKPSPIIPKDHPAPYSVELLPVMAEALDGLAGGVLLDPMAGSGRASQVAEAARMTYVGIEKEPEWAVHHPSTMIGDARQLPFADQTFDAVVVSPAYANRMADGYRGSPKDREYEKQTGKRMKRLTYAVYLERALSDGNGASMAWGRGYRDLHEAAWADAERVLKSGARKRRKRPRFILNVKNHIRGGSEVDVTQWHVDTLLALGMRFVSSVEVETSNYKEGANSELRLSEQVIRFDAP